MLSYREGLWDPHLRHVDRDSGATGDHQGRVPKTYLDLDVTGRGPVMVAHLDLYRTFMGKFFSCGLLVLMSEGKCKQRTSSLSGEMILTVKSKGRPGLKFFVMSGKDMT